MPSGARPKAKVAQLSQKERITIDGMIRREKASATEAWRRINRDRVRLGVPEVGNSAVHRYARGATHKLGAEEHRGRKHALNEANIKALDKARLRLIKKADNEYRVTWANIVSEAGLEGVVSERVCADALRSRGVRFTTPRRKIQVSEEDAKKRLATARVWVQRPASDWESNVHAYVDNKAFPMPLTPAQRKRFRQTMVTGHLRKPSEGILRGFTKPREKHSFIGLPSVNISAAVGKGRVIMRHVVKGSWNGAAAATMYEDHLRPSLERVWGKRARFTIVEDGDKKGNTSGKGVQAKARAHIHAMTLPPRIPSLMPLDYAIWQRIVTKVMEGAPAHTERKDEFLTSLRRIARSLPKPFVRSVVAQMKRRLRDLIASKGFAPKND